jgi:hypothetical protein
MTGLESALQAIAALVILNVWTLRFGRATAYRGGTARNMAEEFAVYGLPPWSVLVVGTAKVSCALALLLGFLVPSLVDPAAALLGLLMTGAVAMHVKVGDPLRKTYPAAGMAAICAVLLWL